MIFLLDFLVPTLDLEFFGFPTLGFHVSLGQSVFPFHLSEQVSLSSILLSLWLKKPLCPPSTPFGHYWGDLMVFALISSSFLWYVVFIWVTEGFLYSSHFRIGRHSVHLSAQFLSSLSSLTLAQHTIVSTPQGHLWPLCGFWSFFQDLSVLLVRVLAWLLSSVSSSTLVWQTIVILFYPLVVIIPTFGDLQGVWFIHISMTGRCSCPFVSSVSPPSFFFHFGLASHCALLSIPMGSSFFLLVPHGLFGLFYISRIGLRSCPCVSLSFYLLISSTLAWQASVIFILYHLVHLPWFRDLDDHLLVFLVHFFRSFQLQSAFHAYKQYFSLLQ